VPGWGNMDYQHSSKPPTLYVILMEHFILNILFMSLTSFSNLTFQDGNKFGLEYNAVRQKFGAPLVKPNMQLDTTYGSWFLYAIPVEPRTSAYHYSKAVCLVIDDKVIQEKDIYRKYLDDTTLLQMEIDIVYDWNSESMRANANFRKIDKRTFAPNSKNANVTQDAETNLQSLIENSVKQATDNYLKQQSYPKYKLEVINLDQIDSLLNSWQLSRFDK
jgi:hypothetical protein